MNKMIKSTIVGFAVAGGIMFGAAGVANADTTVDQWNDSPVKNRSWVSVQSGSELRSPADALRPADMAVRHTDGNLHQPWRLSITQYDALGKTIDKVFQSPGMVTSEVTNDHFN